MVIELYLTTDLSITKIEAKITHIKTLKRVSNGFKSFDKIKLIIFVINNVVKITKNINEMTSLHS